MDEYPGDYNYLPLRKGIRWLVKKDGTFPPPDLPDDTAYFTASVEKYRMETRGNIRILELLPGEFSDPLRCQLRTAALESNPVYDALSYRWGDPIFTGRIILEDNPFPVTPSLENALRHVRLPHNVRYLWADAVCINQNDDRERGNQVHLMKEIYSRSKTVRVWIDVDLDPASLVIQRLLNLHLQGTKDQLGDDPEFWKPLLPLLQNQYWDRLWIQQELAFAPRLEFHCRKVAIPGDCLMALQHHMFRKSARDGGPFGVDNAWSLFRPLVSTTKAPARNLAYWREMMKNKVPVDPHTLQPDFSLLKPKADWQLDPIKWGPSLSTSPIYLLGMLRLSQALNASEARDRVIATLNLVIDYNDDGTETSYDQSLTERYTLVTKLLPFKCNSLQFLTLATIHNNSDPAVEGLPSWVPDWGLPGNADYFSGPFHAAGNLPMYDTPFSGLEDEDDILHARGFRYAKVNGTLSSTNNAFSPLAVLSHLFISTNKSTGCHFDDIKKLGSTITGPAISELRTGPDYFSHNEVVLYTGILLGYWFVTPGLRIIDLLPYAMDIYDQSQRDVKVALRALRKFRDLRPSCLRWLDLESLSAAVQETQNQTERFRHFVQLAHKTLSSGCLASTSSATTLAITEGKAVVETGDEMWILFGCPTPMVLRRTVSDFLVVSPAYICDIMNGEAMDGVTTPDDNYGSWPRILAERRLGTTPAFSYESGRSNRWVEVIRIR